MRPRTWPRCWPPVACIMRDLPRIDEPDFWSGAGCVRLFAVFLAVISIAAGVLFALGGSVEGLLLVIIFLLAGILVLLATGGR